MRPALLSLLVALLSCSRGSTRSPDPSRQPVVAPAGSTLTGTIDGRAFVARAALLVRTTEWQGGRVTARIHVFERPATCADAEAAIPGERTIQIQFGVRWPVMPGSVWVAQVGHDEWARPDSTTIAFMKHGASHVGSYAGGRIEVESASPTGGVLSVQATRTGQASASGSVHFAVCP